VCVEVRRSIPSANPSVLLVLVGLAIPRSLKGLVESNHTSIQAQRGTASNCDVELSPQKGTSRHRPAWQTKVDRLAETDKNSGIVPSNLSVYEAI
jgi:hypothetical protein